MLAGNTDGARVQICHDRACTSQITTIDATGTSAAPTSDLPTGVSFWRLLGRVGTAVGTTPGPTWEVIVGARTAPTDTSWGTMVDVNGDGYADVIVTSGVSSPPPNPPNAVGYVRVYLGGPSGLATTATTTLTDPAGSNTGFSNIASAGDVNGDGFADIVVGAAGTNNNQGRIYIFAGSASGLSTTPSATIDGPDGIGPAFGSELASAGDVNGDGYADVIVGTSFAGLAHVYLGTANGLSTSPATTLNTTSVSAGSSFGSSIAGIGDINGDGFGDVAVGASRNGSNSGNVYVYLGNKNGVGTSPSATITPPSGAYIFGAYVTGAGDVNGDGLADVVIASQGFVGSGGQPGLAYVYLGTTSGLASTPQTSVAGGLDPIIAGAGDVNGSGFAAIIVADTSGSSTTGSANIYEGGLSGIRTSSPFANLVGPSGGLFGAALAAGDVNGDGFCDVIVGAPQTSTGDVYLYPGSTGTFATSPATTLPGPSTDTGFGSFLD